MALHYSTIGPAQQLKDDLLVAIADRALFGDEPADIRTHDEFARRAGEGWRRLTVATREVCEPLRQALATYSEVDARLQKPLPSAMTDSVRDMTEQLRWLFAPHLMLRTPFAWLKHLPRFVKGIDIRLKKVLDAGLSRDMAAMAEVRPLWRRYVDRAKSDAEKGRHDPELAVYRWMVEEFRVSLFAQELKTSMPISAKRLEVQWAKVGR